MTTTDVLMKNKSTAAAAAAFTAQWSRELATEVQATAQLVSKVTDVPWEMILGRRRYEDVAIARMILWCIIRNRGYSYARIGKATGRDHAAIMHANKVIPERYGLRQWKFLTRWVDVLEQRHNVLVISNVKPSKQKKK